MLRALLSVSFVLISSIALSQMKASSPSAESHSGSSSAVADERAVDQTHSAAPPNSDFLAHAKSVPVTYPAAAQQNNTQGYVVVKITVNENGNVEEAENISGDPILAAAGVDASRQWKFQPFSKDGKPIKVSTKVELLFAIADGKCTNGVKQETVTTPFEHKLTVEEKEMRRYICKKVSPSRPSLAELARVRGDVVMAATVGKDGIVQNLAIISAASPILIPPALDAVKQWRYRPYVVSGEPVPVETTIKVTFY